MMLVRVDIIHRLESISIRVVGSELVELARVGLVHMLRGAPLARLSLDNKVLVEVLDVDVALVVVVVVGREVVCSSVVIHHHRHLRGWHAVRRILVVSWLERSDTWSKVWR